MTASTNRKPKQGRAASARSKSRPRAVRQPSDNGGASVPRYQQLADELTELIAKGKYPVGGRLPTELTLTDSYGVSRHTVREALRRLRDAGLISRRRRAGTEVTARTPPASYRQPTNSIRDFLQYAETTRVQVLRTKRVLASAALAEQLESRPGHAWLEVESIRTVPGDADPICFTKAYVDTELIGIDQRLDRLDGPISALLERVYGVRIARINQSIDAVRLTQRHARTLNAPPGSPALRALRRYYDDRGRLIELSTTLHPADRFSYETSLIRG